VRMLINHKYINMEATIFRKMCLVYWFGTYIYVA
jgi:hypothetical protein